MRELRKGKTSKPRGTVEQHKTKSLFKFQVIYNRPVVKGEMPNVVYSTDAKGEREMFCPGLTEEQRKMWIGFVAEFDSELFPEECLDFFGQCYPEFSETECCIVFSNQPSAVKFIATLTPEQRAEVKKLAKKHGFELVKFRPVDYNSKGVRPHVTPMFHKEMKEFNGLNAVKRWFVKHIVPKGVIEIRVYDNLAYHAYNLIETWVFEENIKKMSEASKRPSSERPVQRVGDLIGKFEQQKQRVG